ncbi:hypothetical protein CIPAW_05G010600 [Carya illinoinensis]|uniref:CCHC-type domain-containing protein n=1 Tax=Carya illinoinensis TaxID=32201 RepID=A0A8T1QD40_CARIL|nr:hypothetical protein CIPAW_05G010600 [Carya illinoinensis]
MSSGVRMGGRVPICGACNRAHEGECRMSSGPQCYRCGQVGHIAWDCSVRVQGSRGGRHGERTNPRQAVQARVYAVTTGEVDDEAPATHDAGVITVIRRTYCRKPALKAMSFSIRCEQSTKDGNSVDVWLGRLAMVGFAVAISVEIATGKGLLENFGLTSPLPTVALAITGLVGVLTAIFIFQSASKD